MANDKFQVKWFYPPPGYPLTLAAGILILWEQKYPDVRDKLIRRLAKENHPRNKKIVTPSENHEGVILFCTYTV